MRPLFLLFFACAAAQAQPAPAGTPADTTLLTDLLTAPVELGDTYWASERDEPASVTIISAEEIERYGYRTLLDALEHVRGFTTSTDYYYGQAGARGLSIPDDRGRRMLITVDGESVHEHIFGGVAIDPGLTPPLDALERIEVVRGPGSARFGTGALTLVVNLVTKSGQRLAGARARVTQFGSDGTSAHLSLGNAGRELVWAVSAAAHDRTDEVPAEAPSALRGLLADALNRDRGLYATGQASWRSFHAVVAHGMREKIVPTAPFLSQLGAPFTAYDQRTRLSLTARHIFSPSLTASARASATYYYGSAGSFSGQTGERSASHGHDAGASTEAQLEWTPRAWYGLRAGVEGRWHPHVEYSLFNGLLSGSVLSNQRSVFAEQEVGLLPTLTATAGARYDYLVDDEVTRSFNPRGALVYTPTSRTSLKVLYSSSFRAASAFEQRARGQVAPLRAERFRGGELIWMQRWTPRLALSLSAYRYALTDLIASPADDLGSIVNFTNRIDADLQGVEGELRYRRDRAGAYLQAAYQRAHDRTLDGPLPNAPNLVVQAGGHAESRWGQLAVQGVGRSGVTGLNPDAETEGWWTLHATYTAPLLWDRYRAQAQVRNALDHTWYAPGSPTVRFAELAQPGRRVRLSISATL